MTAWSTAGPAVTAAFLASLVEVVEAFTVILAVATVRGWRPATAGALAALASLALLVLAFGPLIGRLPVRYLRLAVGVLLLLFGISWWRKAVLRRAGLIPVHDEDALFAARVARLDDEARRQSRLDWLAGATAFKAVLLEGLEVAFVVVAVGAGRDLLVPASLGALAACGLVIFIGLILHRPLSRVPENDLMFAVGAITSSFGVFWTGEGLGIAWPGGDLALLSFCVAFIVIGLSAARFVRSPGGGIVS